MDPSFSQHASAVAREVVRIGLADQDSVRRLYQDYTAYLEKGVRATFTQLLLSRGVIDQGGFDRIQGALPAPGGGAALTSTGVSQASSVVSLPGPPTTTPSSDRLTLPGPPLMESTDTLEFDNVLSPYRGRAADPGAAAQDQPLTLSGESTPGTYAHVPVPQLGSQTPTGSAPDFDASHPGTTFDMLDLAPESTPIGQSGVRSTTDSSPLERPAPGDLDLVPDVVPGARDPSDDFIMSDSVVPDQDQTPDAPQTEPQPGDPIGGYRLIKVIGRGGMGVIYTATKEDTGEVYGLKVLLGGNDKGSDRRRQRFRREVEAMRRLEHDNIVKVYDYGRKGHFDWYSMDFIEGKDFEVLLEEGDMEPAEKMQVYLDICAAMAHAHERSVIHRDLKPQNVLVDGQGRGHVLDFGLAKIMDQGIGMTRTGSALGTPYYMAPEQLRSAKHIDTRADVFSLGVILYEISVGVRPFQGETAAEVGTNILNTEPPRPTVLKPNLHPDVDAMVVKSLEKDPDRRYQDANELLEDMIRHKKGFGVEGVKGVSGAVGDARRWAERNRAAIVGGAIVAMVFLPLLMWQALSGPDRQPPRRRGGKTANKNGDKPGGKKPGDKKPGDKKPGDKKPGDKKPGDKKPGDKKPGDKKPGDKKPVVDDPPPTKDPKDDPPDPVDDPGGTSTATAIDKPAEARTPEEKTRLALAPPDESGPSGAEETKSANSSEEAQRSLFFALESMVIPAMAVGDTQRAEEGLGEMRRNAGIKSVRALAREVENDIQTLTKLRKLVGIRLKKDPKVLKRPSYWAGDRFKPGKLKVRDEDGFLEIRSGSAWSVVDPLSLRIESLQPIVIAKASRKKKTTVGNASAYYGLAVLSLYRGLSDKKLLDKAGGDSAVRRRRRTLEWWLQARPAVWAAFQKEAENAWRELDRKKKASEAGYLRALGEYVGAFGRTKAYADRRAEWVTRLVALRSLPDVVHGKNRKGTTEISWGFKGSQLQDFMVRPFDAKSDRPFRAERQGNSIALENGRVAFPLGDLYTTTAMVELSSREEDLVFCFLGEISQEIDPDASWVVKFKGKKLGEDLKGRKIKKPKKVYFEEKRDQQLRLFRIKPKVIEVAAKPFGKPPTRPGSSKLGSLGAQAAGHLRVSGIELAWNEADNKGNAKGLRKQLIEQQLLRTESEEALKPGRGAQVILRNVPESLAGFMLFGDWKAGRREITAGQGAAFWCSRWARYGVFEFEFACDDGPGVRLNLSASFKTKKRGEVSWRLPSTLKTDPGAWRKVVCRFNLRHKMAAVEVDGVPLVVRRGKLPGRSAYFGIEFLGRTEGRVRNLRVIEFTPR